MILVPLQFQTDIEGTQSLFFRGNASVNEQGALVIEAGGLASFDTYFNLFSHEKYAKYCGISSARLCLTGRGRFRVCIYRKTEKGDELLKSAAFCDRLELVFDLPQGGGFVWFSLEAPDGGELLAGAFEADIPSPNEVKLGIVICTYKREEFIKRNMDRVQKAMNDAPEWKERMHFFIADNAKSLKLPENALYTVLPNRNLGGSGGFTRGIIEVCKDSSYTHFLLMDDDISFEFATLARTYNLLCALTPEHRNAAVGGAMLVLENPAMQYEFGGIFNGTRMLPCNRKFLLDRPADLLKNEAPIPANYNAWWYCCMPVSCVAEHGLPLPFFIKGDDVEYGLRCIRELILLNGIGIWHQDFSKKYNSALEYYLKRNQLVINALHFSAAKSHPALVFLYSVLKQLSLKNYEAAEVILRAYEDFFKGPQFFIETDPERLNAEILRFRPKELTREELAANCGSEILQLLDSPEKKKTSSIYKRALAMLENFVPGFFFRNKPRVFDTVNIQPNQTFLVRRCIYFKPDTESGILCELDTKRRRTIRRRTYRIFFKLLFRYKKMRRNYCRRAAELYSAAEWKKKFEQ